MIDVSSGVKEGFRDNRFISFAIPAGCKSARASDARGSPREIHVTDRILQSLRFRPKKYTTRTKMANGVTLPLAPQLFRFAPRSSLCLSSCVPTWLSRSTAWKTTRSRCTSFSLVPLVRRTTSTSGKSSAIVLATWLVGYSGRTTEGKQILWIGCIGSSFSGNRERSLERFLSRLRRKGQAGPGWLFAGIHS